MEQATEVPSLLPRGAHDAVITSRLAAILRRSSPRALAFPTSPAPDSSGLCVAEVGSAAADHAAAGVRTTNAPGHSRHTATRGTNNTGARNLFLKC